MKANGAKIKLQESADTPRGDPVRQAIRHLRTTGVALEKALRAAACRSDDGETRNEFEISLTASTRKASELILEFSTKSPGRRQSVELMVIGDDPFLEIPGSKRLVKRLKLLAEQAVPSESSAKRR